MKKGTHFYKAMALAILSISSAAWADEQKPGAEASPAAAAAPTQPALQPAMGVTLASNPEATNFDFGSAGKVYVTGILSGIGLSQTHSPTGDRGTQTDINNAQIFINKAEGLVQFFVQAGYYSVPVLGVPYMRSNDATRELFDSLPQGYLKIAPTDEFSVMVGALPTLIGAESTFSFQNMNIQRGLLWNQENAVNRGVQVNYATGPLSFSASVNDGFYSDRYNWVSLSASYAFDPANTLVFAAGGDTKHTNVSTFATPVAQNNQQIYNLIYTHTEGPWTFQPYLQYTNVPKISDLGLAKSASTMGGALLMSYDFGSDAAPAGVRLPGFKLPVRLEYISSTGNASNGAPNLLGYGAGSKAWSFTVTPTYQYQKYFARAELSYVGAEKTTSGLAFGADGNKQSQTRAMFEVGVLF